MNEEKIAYFKKKLEEELEKLEKQLADLANPDIDQSATESDEIADRLEEQEENQEESAALTDRLHDVKAALDKIEDGTYGTCDRGDEIEEERLEANPAARTCTKHM